jgi:hypothetical protein
MIRFSLRCDREHQFDSWFGSSADYDRLTGAKMVSCAVCGSTSVQKDLMAPGVASGAAEPARSLSALTSPAEQALGELRRKIEATSENVGTGFAAEARRIHNGEAQKRSIYGEARISDARALIEDGIKIAPLPWSSRKTN